ncbi:MAG: FAD-dependent oxidoreductase [Verrucomicrobiales bacterium]
MDDLPDKENQQTEFDCIVVGAGISGLLAATVMTRAGARTCVLDKGRGVGGRMATRRRDGAVFDHGAQFFTARDERFLLWVDDWQELGLVEPWYDYPHSGVHYRGVPGMTGIAKYLAGELDVRTESAVTRVTYHEQGKRWHIESADATILTSAQLVLTAPVPQSLALLKAGNFVMPERELDELKSIGYHRCIAALAILDAPSALTEYNGALKLRGGPVQWIGDNYRKGISPAAPSVTIHSTPAFAEENWDVDDSVRLPKLLEAATPYVQANVVSCHGHRWGFSSPIGRFSSDAYIDPERGLAIAGDGLAGGRVEGAAISGLTAASELAGGGNHA